MAGMDRFDAAIGRWLEETAPTRLHARVLDATFERTRRSKQDVSWHAALSRLQKPLFARRLGGAAVAVAATAMLAAGVGVIGRISEPTPSPSASTSPSVARISPPGFMWPQTTFAEVQAAQQGADAGDPLYTWQLHPDLGPELGQNHPKNAKIFTRFIEEVLRWEAYLWDEAFAHPEGLVDGQAVYIRCAPGPECSPTVDRFQYETVKISVAQPARTGDAGVWVVTGWEMIQPAVDPPTEAEVHAFIEAFLRARIDGQGAEAFAEFPSFGAHVEELVSRDIPLLYATSTGAPYERSEFQVLDSPIWPRRASRIVVRLFAENGQTRVEQGFSLDLDDSDGLRLEYDFKESTDAGPGTTENGEAVPMEYGFLDGVVTYRAAYPLGPSEEAARDWDRLVVDGVLPDDDATRRIVFFMADPRPLSSGCVDLPASTDAATLARILGSLPDSKATAPVAVTIGGLSGLRIDGVFAHETTPCVLLQPTGGLARLYLLDLPGGPARVLGIAAGADEDSFETVLDWAQEIIETIEFHAP